MQCALSCSCKHAEEAANHPASISVIVVTECKTRGPYVCSTMLPTTEAYTAGLLVRGVYNE